MANHLILPLLLALGADAALDPVGYPALSQEATVLDTRVEPADINRLVAWRAINVSNQATLDYGELGW